MAGKGMIYIKKENTVLHLRLEGISNYPPAEPEALRLLAPQRGLIAIAKERENQNSMDRSGYWFSAPKYKCVTGMHIPENVKLWASPGRAGGLLTIII